MNALNTFIDQIETHGTLVQMLHTDNILFKYYRIDAETIALIQYSLKTKIPYKASFFHS